MKAKRVKIWVDGASRGNPGQAAIGVIIKDEQGKKIKPAKFIYIPTPFKRKTTFNSKFQQCMIFTPGCPCLITRTRTIITTPIINYII